MTKIRALKGKVLIHNIEQGDRRTRAGIIVTDDNGKERGIRERWAQIYAVGPDIDEARSGDWCLVKHGRWSRAVPFESDHGIVELRQVDWPDGILVVTSDKPSEFVDV